MFYPLGAISSLTNGNITVNGSTSTYFSVLEQDDEVTLNEETVAVSSALSDSKFTVKTAFTSGASGDIIYVSDKCVWLKYQIWKLENTISNYDVNKFGLDTAKNGADEIQFNTQSTPLSELLRLKSYYEQELEKCNASKNDSDIWIVRRYEYGTL